jgi:hypothetical protein
MQEDILSRPFSQTHFRLPIADCRFIPCLIWRLRYEGIFPLSQKNAVPAPWMVIKSFEVFYQPGSQWIDMDVAYKFQKIPIFLADNGFVTILEEMSGAFMSFVESDRISGHLSSHDFAERRSSGPQQGMEMVWNERPRVTLGLSRLKDIGKPLKKRFAVLIVAEDLSPFNPPGHDVLQKAWSI